MTSSSANLHLDVRSGPESATLSKRVANWSPTFFRGVSEDLAAPGRSSIESPRRPPRLVWMAIIAFYAMCALAMLSAPATPRLDMFAITSP